ncbi:unnamed protein product, partial [Nesidiocoris tenuis]
MSYCMNNYHKINISNYYVHVNRPIYNEKLSRLVIFAIQLQEVRHILNTKHGHKIQKIQFQTHLLEPKALAHIVQTVPSNALGGQGALDAIPVQQLNTYDEQALGHNIVLLAPLESKFERHLVYCSSITIVSQS